MRTHADAPFRPAAFEAYFRDLYWAKGDEALDAYRMYALLGIGGERRRDGDLLDFRFRTAAERFRMIDDDQETIVVEYDDHGRAAVARLRRDGAERSTLRALQRYTVPVPRRQADALRSAMAVETVDGVTVLIAPDLYRDDVGLDLATLEGPTIEGLIA